MRELLALRLASVASRRLNVGTLDGGTTAALFEVTTGPATLQPVRYEPDCRGTTLNAGCLSRRWESQPSAATTFAAEGYALRWLVERSDNGE